MTAPMTKPLPNLRAEIERGPQEVREVRGDFPDMYVVFEMETTAQFATRIALQALEKAARIAERPGFLTAGARVAAKLVAKDIRAFAATLGQEEELTVRVGAASLHEQRVSNKASHAVGEPASDRQPKTAAPLPPAPGSHNAQATEDEKRELARILANERLRRKP